VSDRLVDVLTIGPRQPAGCTIYSAICAVIRWVSHGNPDGVAEKIRSLAVGVQKRAWWVSKQAARRTDKVGVHLPFNADVAITSETIAPARNSQFFIRLSVQKRCSVKYQSHRCPVLQIPGSRRRQQLRYDRGFCFRARKQRCSPRSKLRLGVAGSSAFVALEILPKRYVRAAMGTTQSNDVQIKAGFWFRAIAASMIFFERSIATR
jgi:hypothetical protein